MKRSTASGKNREFVVIIFVSACTVGFCKRCCPVAEKEASVLKLLIG